MKRFSCLFCLGWFLLLYVFSTTYFLRGFLLIRREIHLKSSNESLLFANHNFKRVIILVIDALRYDFINYKNASAMELLPYHNKLTVIHDLLSHNHAMLYKFVADPPTTTMQRLKGLTTGSLPTFIDIGSNFASDELMEDNLIYQLDSAHLSITFMGDDTWMGLFPRSFKPSYPFPSFDVWDIHTVDDGVTQQIENELQNENWNLLVAHCLGVDHVGHRYGPYHPVMAEKLLQMNNLIKYISKNMGEKTILFVMGDHGMTRNGDHGGDSSDETTAGLFVYSPMLNVKHEPLKQVNQIDLVPTLALLMGIPIPYSNLGTAILDLIHPKPLSNFEAEISEEIQKFKTLTVRVQALYLNVYQVWHYLNAYNQESPINSKEYQELIGEYVMLQKEYEALNLESCNEKCYPYACCPEEQELEQFLIASQKFLFKAREMCRSMWARFDLPSMITGLALFFITIMVHVIHILNPSVNFSPIHWTFLLTILSFLTSFLHRYLAIVLLAPALLYHLKRAKPRSWIPKKCHRSAAVTVILALLYTSNSFVVEEPYVAHFLSQTLIWASLIASPCSRYDMIASLTLSVSTRLGLLYFRCREEQIPYCEANNLHRSISSLAAVDWLVIVRGLFASVTCLSAVYAIPSHVNFRKTVFRMVLIIVLYWIAQLACVAFGFKEDLVNPLPWSFYILFVSSLALQIATAFLPGKNSLFEYNLSILLLFWALSLLLGGDGLAPGVVTVLANILLFRHFCSRRPTTSARILYGLLSMHGFFATGHHTTLPNIPWEAAFVGFSHARTPSFASNLLPAFLVSYSTASSVFLHALAIPICFPANVKEKANRGILKEYLIFLVFHAIQLFGCMMAATIHRRHLMVWKIFAPRLLYELLLSIYVAFGLLLSAAYNHKANM